MRVEVQVTDTTLEGEYRDVDGLSGQCERCGHTVEVYGDSDASERALCVKMREECPEGENNFYVTNR